LAFLLVCGRRGGKGSTAASTGLTFHGEGEFANPDGFRLREKIRASLFSRAISLHGLSQMLKIVDYREWPKIEVASLGVDPREFEPRPFCAGPDPFQIVCVGQLTPVKGQPKQAPKYGRVREVPYQEPWPVLAGKLWPFIWGLCHG
jgi:glycosyltransferase involved in cell wall biosynthesis